MKLNLSLHFFILLILIILYYKLINKKQSVFKKTLEDMKKILDSNKINFFLYCGTSLGAHRERKFIEHDPDIDIGILDKDFHKVQNVMNKYKHKFKLQYYLPEEGNIDNCSELTYKHKSTSINIDIFKVFKTSNGYVHYSFGSICSKKKNKRCEFLNKFNFENIKFLGKTYKTVDKNFLVSHYGHDWHIVKKFSYNDGLSTGKYKSLQ